MGREGGGGKGPKGGQGFFLEPETWIRGEQPGSLSAAGRRRSRVKIGIAFAYGERSYRTARRGRWARLTFGGGC